MPGSKALLKTVLKKSLLTTTTQSQVSTIFGLAQEYCRIFPQANEIEIQQFLGIIREVNGEDPVNIKVQVDGGDQGAVVHVRHMLRGTITEFMRSIEKTSPHIFDAINSIDWRNLFGIENASPVHVVVNPPSDEDCGGASLDSPSQSIEMKNCDVEKRLGTKENISEPKNLTDTIREVLTKAKQLACEIAAQKKEKSNTESTTGDGSSKKESADAEKKRDKI